MVIDTSIEYKQCTTIIHHRQTVTDKKESATHQADHWVLEVLSLHQNAGKGYF